MTERKLGLGENLSRTLNDVVCEDYFSTQKLIRKVFFSRTHAENFEADIEKAQSWLEDSSNQVASLSGLHLPDYVERNRYTIGLYLEFRNEPVRNKTALIIPVAFDTSSEGLIDDIKKIKESAWYKDRGKNSLTNPDLLSFAVFTKYWHTLSTRAKILRG